MKNIKLLEAKRYIAKLIKEEEEDNIKTISALADKFLQVSKGLRKGDYPGVQSAEISEINILVDMVMQAAMETNITTIIKRLESIVGKSIKGTVELPGQEDELDIEDETI